MAANNDILELFEMVGTVAIDVAKSVKELTDLENLGQETADSLQADFERAFRSISRLTASPDIDINSESALSEIQAFRQTFEKMLKDLEANGKVDFNTDPAVKDLQALRLQAESLERMFEGSEGDINVDVNEARAKLSEMMGRATALRTTLSGQDYQVNVKGNEAVRVLQQIVDYARRADAALTRLRDRFTNLNMDAVINETVNRVIKTTYDNAGDPGVMGSQVTPSGDQQSNGPPSYGSDSSLAHSAVAGATAAAMTGMGAVGAAGNVAARRVNQFGYDLNRANRAIEAYHRRMLNYAMRINPQNTLGMARQRLEISMPGFDYFKDSKNMIQLMATYGMIEQGITGARRQLSQLGFGRTKTEIKAIENQMHAMANVRLDNLRDQIKLTEKALSEMKKSANADELTDEIAKTEAALKKYKKAFQESAPVDQIAKANGYAADKIFGKDVIYKPFSNALDKMGGRIVAFANKDLAYLQNKTYEAIDNAATKIVGPQTTKAETKMKINQLAMRYQMFGMQLNTFVTPAVLGLAAAFGMVAAKAEDAANKFQARTLTSPEDMKEFKDDMEDVYVSSGAAREEVSLFFSTQKNATDASSKSIKKLADQGFAFAKVWGSNDAATALQSIDMIKDASNELGISQEQAANALALALKRNNGDFARAQQDLEDYGDLYKNIVSGKGMSDKDIRAEAERRVNEALQDQSAQYKVLTKQKKELEKQIKSTDDPAQVKILEQALQGVQRDMDRLNSQLGESKQKFIEKEVRQLQELAQLGPDAFKLMTAPQGSIEALGESLRQMTSAMVELAEVLAPTIIKIADGITEVTKGVTELLRANPGLASFIAHVMAIGGAGLVLLGIFAPIAGFLIRFRGLFQGLAQGLGLAGKGAVILSPQVRMLVDSMTMLRNGIIGLPRLFRSLFPGVLSFLRALPGMVAGFVVQFIRMNPILTAISALTWVIYKNWERFEPILASIWDSLKRIGNSIIQAFAGPGQTGAEGFSVMMDKLAKILGDVLIPLFEILAKVLEVVAVMMEGGGGNVVAYGMAGMFLLSVIGKLIPGLGMFGSLLGLVTGKASKGGAALKGLGSIVSGLGGMFTKAGPLLAKGAKGMFSFLPTLFRGAGGLIARLGMMLIPLLANPFVLAGVAIVAALVGVGVLIYKNWDKIKSGTVEKVKQITGWLKKHWGTIISIFGGPIVAAGVAIFKNFDVIKAGVAKGARAVIDAAKRSWSGFAKEVGGTLRYQLGGLAKIFSAAGDILKKVFIGIFVGFPQLVGRYLRLVLRVASAVLTGLGRMFMQRLNAVRRITVAALGLIGRAFRGAMTLWARIVSGGMALIRRIYSAAFSFIGRVIRGALTLWARLISNGMALIRRIFTAVLGFLRRTVSSTFSFIGRTIRAALALWGRIITAGLALIRRIFSTTVAFLRRVVSAAFSFIARVIRSSMQAAGRAVTQILGTIRRVFASVLTFIRTTVASVFRSVYNSIRNALSNAYRVVRDTLGKIGSFFSKMGKKAFSWGEDILRGLVRGIRSGVRAAVEAIIEVGSAIEKAFRKVMGIFSPSRVFEGLGFHLPEGAAEGVTRGTPLVTGAVTDMGLAASGSFDAAAIVNLDTEVDGDPLDMIKQSLGGAAAKAKAKFKNVINPNQTTQFNQESRAQMNNVEKVEVHVSKLATDQDFNELGKKVQKHITDETNKEVRRRG